MQAQCEEYSAGAGERVASVARSRRWFGAVAVTAGLLFGAVATPPMASAQIFDWHVTAPGQADPAITPAPFLRNNAQSAAEVAAYLSTLKGQDVAAVKVVEVLTDPAALAIFDNFRVNYVLVDYEAAHMANHVAATQNLVNQVQSSQRSRRAIIGNYDFLANQAGVSGLGMTNTSLYPGGSEFNSALVSTPNIRSALFVAPIQKFSAFEAAAPDAPHIPYATRFNNWQNETLGPQQGTYSSPVWGNQPRDAYFFNASGTNQDVQGQVILAQAQFEGQLLSRGDFSAMILHYRYRGADGFHLFEPGVVGYTKAEMQADAFAGWNHAASSAVLTANKVERLGGGVNESLGTVWSGAFVQQGQSGDLLFLVSNMGDSSQSHADVLGSGSVGGFSIDHGSAYMIPGGEHHLLSYELVRFRDGPGPWEHEWQFVGGAEVFDDHAGRFDVGIPEPASSALLLGAGLLLLHRRRRA